MYGNESLGILLKNFLTYHDMLHWIAEEAAPGCFEIIAGMTPDI
jgi:hypothetical protein